MQNTFRKRLLLNTLIIALPICLLSVVAKGQIISKQLTINQMHQMLVEQKQLAAGRQSQLFGILDGNLSVDERQLLEYLYAYMPLSDLADYNGDYFLEQVQTILKARDQMPWGKTVPEDVLLHFVLPPRVNNENLDRFRPLMFDELSLVTKGLTMRDAALEVNHWCHQKMNYRSSDERTSSPLASMKTSFGRCGEESTFAVTAMRTIGIPARQVYTPRWAHCDDNHAWVEVWIDGSWYFLGACEPEPALNMGWFAEPARRAMLVHTRAFGAYEGTDMVIDNQQRFAELNLINLYATSRKITIKVVDTLNQPVEGASVEYQLYNYAEFYPIAKGTSNKQGLSSITTGLGDLLIWASKNNLWGFSKIAVDKMDSVVVVLSDKCRNGDHIVLDIIPPVEKVPLAIQLTEAQKKQNSLRLHLEDSIRGNYMATFKDSLWSAEFAKSQELNPERLIPLIRNSYGNWKEITDFIANTPNYQKEWAVYLLESISEKDLRDTKAEVLRDHLVNSFNFNNTLASTDKEFFARYVLNGRIANEMMVGWRAYLQKKFDYEFLMQFKTNPDVLVDWIKKNIKTDAVANLHSRAPLTPVGVYEMKVADSRSRNIFYVAVCRSLGHAARVNPATGIPQHYSGNTWVNVDLGDMLNVPVDKGFVKFTSNSADNDPKYAINFTIARFSDGVFRTLDFDYGMPLTEFAENTEVESGQYMLVTGNRKADGSVLAKLDFFEIKKGETTTIPVHLRNELSTLTPIAKIKRTNHVINRFDNKQALTIQSLLKDKGCIFIWLDTDKEPSKHVLADLPSVKGQLDKWGGNVVFVLNSEKNNSAFKPSTYKNLPVKSIFVTDKPLGLLSDITPKQHVNQAMPVIAVIDRNGDVYFYSEGYKIGIGEQLVKVLPYLQ